MTVRSSRRRRGDAAPPIDLRLAIPAAVGWATTAAAIGVRGASGPLAVALGSLALASVGVAIGSSVHARPYAAPTGSPRDGRRRARQPARRVDGSTSARIRRAAAALA
ncbi:ComEC/Rec2 family competence protein, partial [Clavibacter phaseoli]